MKVYSYQKKELTEGTEGKDQVRSEWSPMTVLSNLQASQNRFLNMETILGLVKNGLGMGFEGRLINFFATISGQTMHHQGVWFCEANEAFVNLKAGQSFNSR